MIEEFMINIGFSVEHPGIVLWEEYLQPLNISHTQFANEIHISTARAKKLLKGQSAITSDIALRLAKYFETSAEFWINWQGAYDLQQTAQQHQQEYETIQPRVFSLPNSPW